MPSTRLPMVLSLLTKHQMFFFVSFHFILSLCQVLDFQWFCRYSQNIKCFSLFHFISFYHYLVFSCYSSFHLQACSFKLRRLRYSTQHRLALDLHVLLNYMVPKHEWHHRNKFTLSFDRMLLTARGTRRNCPALPDLGSEYVVCTHAIKLMCTMYVKTLCRRR